MTFASFSVATLEVALAAGSAAMAAYAGYSQAQTSKRIAENNAAVAGMQADDALKRGQQAALDARRRGSVIEGQQRTALASRGLSLDEGTPSDVLAQADFFSQMDEATAITNSRKEAWSDRAQQANFQLQDDATNPGLQLAGGLLTGASSVASKWYSYRKAGQ